MYIQNIRHDRYIYKKIGVVSTMMNELEEKLKKTALSAAIDLSIKRYQKAPARCARNLIELANASFDTHLTKTETVSLYQALVASLEQKDAQTVKRLFFQRFGL